MSSNIFCYNSDKPYIEASMVVVRGSSTNIIPGIAHLIEHIQCVAPSGKNTLNEFNEMIEKEDIVIINAYTSPESVSYVFQGLPGTEERIIYWMNRMRSEVPSQDLLDKEKKVVVDEIDKSLKSVMGNYKNPYGQNLLFSSLFPELEIKAQFLNLGDKDSVMATTLHDVEYYKSQYYRNENIIYTFTGAINESKIRTLLKDYESEVSYEMFNRQGNGKVYGELSQKTTISTIGFRHERSLIASEYFTSLYDFVLQKIIRGELGLTYGVGSIAQYHGGVFFRGVQVTHYDGRYDDFIKTYDEVKKIITAPPENYLNEELFNYIKSRKRKSKIFHDFDPIDFNNSTFVHNAVMNFNDPYWDEYEKTVFDIDFQTFIKVVHDIQKTGEYLEVHVDRE